MDECVEQIGRTCWGPPMLGMGLIILHKVLFISIFPKWSDRLAGAFSGAFSLFIAVAFQLSDRTWIVPLIYGLKVSGLGAIIIAVFYEH